MRLVGHRGCAARAPENTVAAVERAAPHVDAVEVDVRRCGSGELVVVHDETLGRLAGVDRPVAETPWDELRSLRVLGSDEGIPRLATLVDALPADVGLNVECKERGLGSDVEAHVATRDDVWVSSFDVDALTETALPRALLFADDWTDHLDVARSLDCAFVHPHYELVLDRPERVAAAHDAGLAVNVWTPPVDVVPRLRDVGVDGVIVDDWAIPE